MAARTGERDGPSDPLIGRTIAGRYLVRRPIGRGGMGAVYEAEHVGLGRRLALKVILDRHAGDREAVERFHREARTASRIGDKHIVQITDVGRTDDGQSYIAMEYLDGSDLAHVLRAAGALDPARAIHIMEQVLLGLEAAHAEGIVHRDLKPENVFLTERGGESEFAVLMDFGISKVLASQEERVRLTHTGVVVGTPIYMAPEQALGQPDLDHRVDLYAAGVMLYELLAGRPPFTGTTYASLVAQHLTEPPPFLAGLRPGLPPGLVSAVHKALEKRREDRFATAADLRAALLAAAADLPHPAANDHRATASMTAARPDDSEASDSASERGEVAQNQPRSVASADDSAGPPRGGDALAGDAQKKPRGGVAADDSARMPRGGDALAGDAQKKPRGGDALGGDAENKPRGGVAAGGDALTPTGAPTRGVASADDSARTPPGAAAVGGDGRGQARGEPAAGGAAIPALGTAAPLQIDVPIFRPPPRRSSRGAARIALVGGGIAAALAVGVWRGVGDQDAARVDGRGGAESSAGMDPTDSGAGVAPVGRGDSAGAIPGASRAADSGGPAGAAGVAGFGGAAGAAGAAGSGGPVGAGGGSSGAGVTGSAAPSGAAVLEIDSGPRGAHVFVDGVHRGRTPVRIEDVAIGSHLIRLELRGYQLVEAEKSVRGGATETFFAALARRGSGNAGSISGGGQVPGGAGGPGAGSGAAARPEAEAPEVGGEGREEGKSNPYLELRRGTP